MKSFRIFTAVLLIFCASHIDADAEKPLPFFEGEEIVYSIKKLGVKAGEAVLTFNGMTRLEWQELYLITFKATGFNFLDEEKIYVDPESFFPVRVERDLNIFGRKEKITEYYEPQNDHVRIVKLANGETSGEVIKKSGRLDNIYCFIYRYRRDGRFQTGERFQIHLPTKDVSISLIEKGNLKAAGQKFETFFMQSDPKEYQVWFDNSPQKVPLRIDGAVGFGSAAMVMTEYYR